MAMNKHIRSVSTSDGFLRELRLEFSPGLNCIIGARGTCKSTIVETIRFAFDDDPERVEVMLREPKAGTPADSHAGLIRASLQNGTARVRLGSASDPGAGDGIVIERDAGAAPRIYLDGVKATQDESILNKIEIYSQGELQEIALDPSKRLALVDRPHKVDIDRWRQEARELALSVAQLGPQIRETREAIAAAERVLTDGEATREALAKAQAERPRLSPEMTEGRAAFQLRERAQVSAKRAVDLLGEEVRRIEEAQTRLEGTRGGLAHLNEADSAPLRALAESLEGTIDHLRNATHAAADDSQRNRLLADAQTEYEAEAAKYGALLQKEREAAEAVRQEDALIEEIEKLDRVRVRLAEQRTHRDDLEASRDEKRAALKDLRSRIYRRRLEEVDRINSEHSEQIVLSLNHGAHSSRFRMRLDDLVSGSRLRERAAICEQIAAVMTPERLIAIVDAEDTASLANLLNRDAGQMARLVSHLADSADLYSLEEEVADDELEITLFVEGSPRAVNEMSKGQKATAILPLVLRPASYPLILDQPEDDLDNRFIFETLIKTVEKLKLERQLVFVTHNANIPVIGDADQVFVMSMTEPDRAEVLNVGSVESVKDEIVGLLEGGRQAFEIRRAKYGFDEQTQQQ